MNLKAINSTLHLWIYFLIIIGVFVIITARNLNGDFYWDESVYADIASHLLKSEFYSPAEPVFTRHPPLYMITLNLLSYIPIRVEITYRLFSILISCAGLFFIFKLLIDHNAKKIGILVLFLLCFNTLFQQYSQSATMYALLFFFHSIIFYGFSKKKKYLEIIGITGGLYTHYFTIITCLIILFIEFIQNPKNFIKDYYGKYLIILLLYLPWLYYFIPGLFFHKGKFKKPLPHINLYNYLFTFGISGSFFIAFWIKKNFNFSSLRAIPKDVLDRFTFLSMMSLSVYLIILLLSTPFVRYLYFLFPMWVVSLIFFFSKYSTILSLKFKNSILKKNFIFAIFILFLFIPNYNLFGIFPYNYSYHDQHDSIYHQHWKSIAVILDRQPVTIENIRSYYFYYRQVFPQIPHQNHPWENIGIYELKYDPYDTKYNMKNLKKITTSYVALSKLGPKKNEMLHQLNIMGYSTFKTIGTSVILKK